MDKITKLPWTIKEDRPIIFGGDGRIVAETVYQGPNDQDKHEANAEYICRAVNSHEGLVEAAKGALWALREIKKDLSRMNDYEDDHPEKEWPDIVRLEEALKKSADGECVK